MKLDIKPFEPAQIHFNFDELSAEIEAKAAEYAATVYTEDAITEAKADRATLNKLKIALDDARKQTKRRYLAPYEAFEAKVKKLIGMIDEQTQRIGMVIVADEARRKAEKRAAILSEFREKQTDVSIQTAPDDMIAEKIGARAFLLSTSMAAASKMVDEAIATIKQELAAVKECKHPVIAENVYYATLSAWEALEASRRKEEADRMEAAVKMRAAEAMPAQPEPQPAQPAQPAQPEQQSDGERGWVPIKVWINRHEGAMLRDFLMANGIRFTQG